MPAYPPQLGPQLEEDVNPEPVAMFMDTGEEKELSMAARVIKAAEEKPSESLKVKVVGNYRVTHQGVAYTGGDVLEVPDDEEHKIWLQSGWVVKEEK